MGQFTAEYRAKLKELSHPLTLVFKPVILTPGRRIKNMKMVSTWGDLTQQSWESGCTPPAVSHRDRTMKYRHVKRTLLIMEEIFGDTGDNNYFSILDASLKFLYLLWWNGAEICVHSVLPRANRPFNSRVLYLLMLFIMKYNNILMAKRC